MRSRGVFIASMVGEAVGEAVTSQKAPSGAGRPPTRPGGLEDPWIHRLSPSNAPHCLPRSVDGGYGGCMCAFPSTVDLTLCFFLSRRIEVTRIADFTNPSAGSMMWQGLPVLDMLHSAFGLHKCVDTSMLCMQVEDGAIWTQCHAGRLGVEPGGLALSQAA